MQNKWLQLFVFPYAGGSVAAFRKLTDLLDNRVDVVAVEYAGRGTRAHEPLSDSFESQLEDAIEYCRKRRDDNVPYALIQNSLIQDNTSLTHGVIYASTGSNVEIDNSLISGNLSWIVGGLYVDGGVMQLRGVVVKENVGIYGAGGVQVNSGQFTVSGGAIYDNYLPNRPGLDVYLAEDVNALIPSTCNMKDSGMDFSESLWLGYYSGNMVDTAIYQPDGYVAVGIKTARPDTVDAVAASA